MINSFLHIHFKMCLVSTFWCIHIQIRCGSQNSKSISLYPLVCIYWVLLKCDTNIAHPCLVALFITTSWSSWQCKIFIILVIIEFWLHLYLHLLFLRGINIPECNATLLDPFTRSLSCCSNGHHKGICNISSNAEHTVFEQKCGCHIAAADREVWLFGFDTNLKAVENVFFFFKQKNIEYTTLIHCAYLFVTYEL